MEVRTYQARGMVLLLVDYLKHFKCKKRVWYLSLAALAPFLYTLFSLSNKTTGFTSATDPVLGKDYVYVSNAEIIEPSLPKQQVQVIEFFSYECEACKLLEPAVEAWTALQPASVRFEQIPMSDGSAVMDEIVRVHYLAHQLKSNMTGIIFKWCENIQNKQDIETIKKNLLNLDVSLVDYERVIGQPAGLDAQINRGKNLEKTYNIQESPIFIIGGCYKTSLAMVKGNVLRLFEIIDALIEKVKQGNV